MNTQLEYLDFVPQQRFQSSGQTVALAISPDAQTVPYATNASGQFNLWTHPVAGGPVRQLTHYTRNAVRNVAWTPDGRSLLIAVDRDGDEQYQLYLLDTAGGDPVRLTAADGRQHWFADRPYDRTGRYLIYSDND
jgi:Tol biopolymer transport system component